jgi:cysteine desulfurase
MKIYFDNAATTPLAAEALNEMLPFLTDNFGNPSSIHGYGRKSRAAIEKARKIVAGAINASTAEVFFTSCGTESNNMVIKQAVKNLGVTRIISSPIEHHCVLYSVESQKAEGIKVEMVNVDQYGTIDHDHLEALLKASSEPTLISLMHANNEIGTLLDLERVDALCEQYKAYFHTDTVQTIGYYPIDVQKLKVHFISGSGHKFNGPKGVGFVYINSSVTLSPFLNGGAQERNMRAGTENIYGIVGLGKALEMAIAEMNDGREYINGLRQYMKTRLDNELADVSYNGFTDDRGHYKILSVSLPLNNKTDLIVWNLDNAGIAASAGSACTSGSEVGSHVLAGIHAPEDRKAVRFSFSKHNTKEEIDYVIEELKKMITVKELATAKL